LSYRPEVNSCSESHRACYIWPIWAPAVHDLEGPPGLRQVVAHGQAELAAADDQHIEQ
jgi:hypothetical protein